MHTTRGLSLLMAVACALVPGCYLAHEPLDDTPPVCSTEPVGGCRAWEAAGPVVTISGSDIDALRSMTAVDTECGVLVAWGLARTDTTVVRFETRTIDWAGVPTGPIVQPPGATLEDWYGVVSLARRLDRAALVAPGLSECLFVPLALDGTPRGAPVRHPIDGGCSAPAPSEEGFSYLTRDATGRALRFVDETGSLSSAVSLPPMPGLMGRIVLDDGSFLSFASWSESSTRQLVSGLRHFDSAGLPLAPAVELPGDTLFLRLSPTEHGALAAWAGLRGSIIAPLRFGPLTSDGEPDGETHEAPLHGSLRGVDVASTPDGDAILSWVDTHFDPPRWEQHVLALGPDGVPRGEMTTVSSPPPRAGGPQVQLVVAPSGGRALAILGHDADVRALPLACVR